MPTIEALTQRTDPIAVDTPTSEVLTRFESDPSLLALAVVQDQRPVGLVERDTFLLKMASKLGRAQYAHRTVEHLMDREPPVVEAGVKVSAVCDVLLRSDTGALVRGFIVTRQGRYLGVGSCVAILRAMHEQRLTDEKVMAEQSRALANSQAQAQAAAQAKSQFLNILGAELRTPLNGVVAVADLLRRQPLSSAALAHVQTIADSSDTLLRILQDALDLARAEAGELELHPAPTPLRAVMDEVQTEWAPRATQDGVTLLVGFEGDTELAAQIDGGRLKQVFNTLIGNALKFARNGVVEASLKAWADGGHIRMEARVRDDGPGVDPDADIFEPFVHADTHEGAGLGLSICRQIVNQMGGRIWAENNAGRGSTFAIDLSAPRAVVQAETASNISNLADLALQSQPHILIVDDNATNRVVAQALCEMFGCTSELAEDGLEALEAVKARAFDLILMDIKMPRMDGVQATQAIRALPGPEAATPIIALTANADPEDAKRYMSIGMAAVVEKPIKPERLRMAMNAAMNQDAEDEVQAPPARGKRSAA
ncbi:MAG TPA: response regulator [Brevundimonas sp.]|uniref:response regulator n=1 Tax=Brevundimonas sp. TaxID=1871086 RepID=UPI00261453F4|nr:response regulator [Brevundimonas sp.]HRO33018.1 response regulator [Brevundimonas sp.]